ncbi:MAG TPA: hypothetical protein VGI97_01470 [Gemmatimonadaceae bacterium]
MRTANLVAFDDFIPKGTAGKDVAVYSPSNFNTQLGRHDMVGVQLVMDTITPDTASRSFYLFWEVSNDGRLWVQRSNQANSFADGDQEIKLTVSTSAVFLQAMWSDACQGKNTAGPLLPFARFRMFFDSAGTGAAAHVRVSVTQRDR